MLNSGKLRLCGYAMPKQIWTESIGFLYIDIKQGPHCKAVSYPDKEQCTSQSHLLAGLVVRDVHKKEDNLRTKYKDHISGVNRGEQHHISPDKSIVW